MYALKRQLYRTEPGRYPLLEECSGFITDSVEGNRMQVRGVDVSKRGFGFICSHQLAIGTAATLEIAGQKIRVEIAYSESYLGIDHMFRCGVFTRDPHLDLHALLMRLGLVARDSEPSI